MNKIENKTNEQLHQEFEDALKNLGEKLYNLLRYGNYQLVDLWRDIETHKLNTATMMVGKHKLYLRSGKKYIGDEGTEVSIHFDENPVREELLEAWDAQVIQKDIDYHRKQLEALTALQKEQQEKLKAKKNEQQSVQTDTTCS